MNTILIPQDRLSIVIKAAYDLSRPQGMGFLHFNAAPMTDEQAQGIIDIADGGPIRMDYVGGRAVKLTIRVNKYRDERQYYLEDADSWFDHFPDEWRKLVAVAKGET